MGEEALLGALLPPAGASGGIARGDAGPVHADVPLVVDLDGTLIRTDSLLESLFVLAKEHPGLLREKGRIGFAGHGDRVEFRNLRIKSLD